MTSEVSSAPATSIHTQGDQSPAIHNDRGTINLDYGSKTYQVGKERIGKKLAIRRMLLIPTHNITWKVCRSEQPNCKDTYEAAFIYLEIQSIWPEPFLLTASSVEVRSPKSNITLGPGMRGDSVIDTKITRNSNPQALLFLPGEVKMVGLAQGLKLNGILDFFRGDILEEDIITAKLPFGIYNIARVSEFNRFIAAKYGTRAALRIQLFERDYRPLLTTTAYLTKGTDFFETGDVMTNSYNFQHDGFIGEVLYQLREGNDPYVRRVWEKNMDKH